MEQTRIIIILLVIAFIIGLILKAILASPFDYPYFNHEFDVTGKRLPNLEDLIDTFINQGGFIKIQNHNIEIQKWKLRCEEKIKNSRLKKYRTKQYLDCLDDSQAYIFSMIRYQTRYQQTNYVKTPYKVKQEVNVKEFDYDYFVNRNELLREIGYECTLNEYHSKSQRKLLTNELRQEIIFRDNFTCQICGKYMPDGVGLQIDHKVPVSKGGKTVRSNLQVLCSKCNGRKSNKVSSL